MEISLTAKSRWATAVFELLCGQCILKKAASTVGQYSLT